MTAVGKVRSMTEGGPPSIEVLGLPVHVLSLPDAATLLEARTTRRAPAVVISLNGAAIMRAVRDPAFAALIREADLAIPDGVGVVLAARLLGIGGVRRLPGVDLAEELCRRAALHRHRVFLLGSRPGVADDAATRLRQRYPGLLIAGTEHGFFSPEQEPAVIDRVRAAAPDVLLVALGVPHQERWLHRHRGALNVPVMMGVGGTLDVLAGHVRRAPRWLQAAGLEWLYRLAREPWRWQIVKTIPPLFLLALRERWRRRRPPSRETAPPGDSNHQERG